MVNTKRILVIGERDCRNCRFLSHLVGENGLFKSKTEENEINLWLTENKPLFVLLVESDELPFSEITRLITSLSHAHYFIVIHQSYNSQRVSELLKLGVLVSLVNDAYLPEILPSYLNLIRDSAEYRKRLMILNKAIEQSPVSVVLTDRNGNIEFANRKFLELTEYELDEVIGKNPRVLQSGQHSKEFYKEMWKTILNGEDWIGEMYNKTKSGKYYWESVVISPVKSKDGEIDYFIGVKEDISEQKALNKQLQTTLAKVEEADKLKAAFLQNMSHEIRTPMNSIIGFSTLLAKTSLTPEKIEKYTGAVITSAKELLRKINDLLIISSLENNEESMTLDKCLVEKLLEKLYLQFENDREARHLSFHLIDNIKMHGLEVECDQKKIEVIVNHLLNNAFKFTPEGSVEFGCDIANENADSLHLEFFVRDTGIGISKEWKSRIFERFVQYDPNTSRRFDGNGIGLAICKGYAEIMGGEIRVDSTLDAGSTFYLTLPVKRVTPVDVVQPKQHGRIPKILVVEDKHLNFVLVREILYNYDVEVLHAVNGQMAIDMAEKMTDLDLILMDIKMPGIDGVTATKKIKELNNKIPVIAQTAYQKGSLGEQYAELFEGYILKPININSLKRMIGDYVHLNLKEEL